MVEAGLSLAEIKESVIQTLSPFFQNQDVLLELALGALVPEAVNVAWLQNEPWAFQMFEQCLKVHRLAHDVAGEDSLRACALWEPATRQGLSEFWSAYHLEVPKDDLALEEFKFEIFRNLGSLIEGTMHPLLRELLHQIRLRDSALHPSAELDTMTLGEVVADLIDTSGFPDLFEPPPWHVRLNQWRNIAQHHSSRIEGNTIICLYGRAPRIRELRITRSELLGATQRIYGAYRAIGTAKNLFLVDNIRVAWDFLPDPNGRPEMYIVNFASAVATQGFEVAEIKLSEEEAAVVLRDVSDLDPQSRRFHASQLAYQLWVHTGRPCVKVEYHEKNGTPNFLTTAWSEDCQKIEQGEIEFGELANLTEMVDLKTGAKVSRGVKPPDQAA